MIQNACLRERAVGIKKRPRLNLSIDLANSREASLDELLRADSSVADQTRRLRCGQQMQICQAQDVCLRLTVVRAPQFMWRGEKRAAQGPREKAPEAYVVSTLRMSGD